MSWRWTDETRAKLRDFLVRHALMDGTPEITVIGDGHSNFTFMLARGDTRLVLRRPPPLSGLPAANDVLREARLLKALEGTELPVPRVLAVGQADDVFDVPFYVMNHIDGIVITESMPDAFRESSAAREFGAAFINGLCSLHALDIDTLGLGDFGRPEGFNARHLDRISRLVSVDGVIVPAFAGLYDWLSGDIPTESGAAIIHNDYRIGNLMWSRKRPATLLAILDWELAALGDPLMDFAYLLASLPEDGVSRTPVQDFATATTIPGFPSQVALEDHYRAATGYNLSQLSWFKAFVNWKLAALYHFSSARGVDPYFADPRHVVRFLEEARRNAGISG